MDHTVSLPSLPPRSSHIPSPLSLFSIFLHYPDQPQIQPILILRHPKRHRLLLSRSQVHLPSELPDQQPNQRVRAQSAV